MNFVGTKVLLREIRESDMPLFNRLINSSDVEKFVVGWSKPVTTNEQNCWYQGLKNDPNIRYTISSCDDSEVFGTLIISKIDWKNRNCALDIKISNEYRGKGIGNEAVSLAINYVFNELNLNRIGISILESNIASQKLFTKNGFQQEGISRKAIFKDGKYNNLILYGLLKEDFINEGNR